MAKKAEVEINNDVVIIKMAVVDQTPINSHNNTMKIINWGKKNNYPNKLLDFAKNHPIHNAILKGKTRYLSGLSLRPKETNPLAEEFLKRANEFESYYSVSKKVKADKVNFGGWVCQVVTNAIGTPVNVYHLDRGKLRLDESLTGMWYSDDWSVSLFKLKKTFLPFYKSGQVGSFVYVSKDFSPSITELDNAYPTPDFASVLLDIETDIEISNFLNHLVRNGFSAGHIINFFSGKLTSEAKESIETAFKHKHRGTDNAGSVVISYSNPDGQPAVVTNISPNGLAEQYEVLNKRNRQNILAGHNVSGVLFKIKADGSQLGNDRNEIDLAHELMINEYAEPEQADFNEFLSLIFKDKTKQICEFEVEQIKTIGTELDLSNQNIINALNARDPNIVTNYIIKKFGLELPVAEIAPITPVMEASNNSLSNLTGKQRQALDGIARKYNKGTLTEMQAILQLKPFGFTEEDAKLYLGIESNILKQQDLKMSSIKSKIIQIDLSDELINEEYFDNVLDIKLSANDKPKKSFIQGLIDSFKKKFSPDEYDTEVYTVYRYDLRKELIGQDILLDTSHQFCIDRVNETKGSFRYTYEAIQELSNGLEEYGSDAWNNKGGFWGKKNSCRHIWVGETRIKKIKK